MAIRKYGVSILITLISASLFAQNQTMQIAGKTRNYIVHAPGGLTNPPLVFCIHGYDMDAASQQSYTQMDKVADREKFIVVYPNAINRSWNLSGDDDFNFIIAIIDSIDKKYQIDRSRIYSCGFSQGGFMTFQLACRYSEIFAAIAPTSGNLQGNCVLKRPMSMRLTFGTNEGFSGGSAAFMSNVTKWIEMCNCPKTPVVTRPYPANNPNSYVTRLYYGPCDGGTEVIADSIRTGGHEWPMNTNDRINNSDETWAFLKKFSLPPTTVDIKRSYTKLSNISASYGSGVVQIKGVMDGCQVRVFDIKGRNVTTALVNKNQFAFKDEASGIYMLLVNVNNRPEALRFAIP